ncbi:MAG: hydantoinase B/oxoprolinase family protein [Alphaproteobacteria bacterium]|nr:hydantoinase B/oxoprolinase family protein [Alphaproteobacteria bacterium]
MIDAESFDLSPITISVVQHRLTGIVQEMGEAMLRTSFSQILNSSRDFSTAICGADSQLVAQADHIPVHVGALQPATASIIAAFGNDVHPGDIFLLNDPYFGGSHLPDVTAFAPVFIEDALAFWAINRAHHSDIGGATYGAYNAAAREIWQEGIRLPPLRFYDRGSMRPDILRLLKANVRHARDFEGDLMAQIGSVRLAERRLHALASEFGGAVIRASTSRILDATEAQARAIFAEWQDGTYEGEAALDDDGRGNDDITIRARVTVAGSDITVDLTDSDPEVTSFLNSSVANTRSAVLVAIAVLLDPHVPKNEGAARPVTILTKPGTIVHPNEGAPVTMCTSHCGNEIIEAVVVALAGACPERAMGGWGRRLRIAIKGEDPRNGRPFIWHMFHARPGGGASSAGDGWHNAGEWHSAGGLKFGSIEVAETRFPLFFPVHEFLPDSGGDGKFVGGNGVDMQLVVETEAAAVANIAGDGLRHGARGMLGGKDGAPHRYLLNPPGADPVVLASKMEGLRVSPGSAFAVHSGGGGGWGPPAERDPAARRRDVQNGLTTSDTR